MSVNVHEESPKNLEVKNENERKKKHIFTPDLKANEGDVQVLEITNTLKNDSDAKLKGFDKNLNINLNKRYFTELDCKENIQYAKVNSYENYSLKPVDKDIKNSEGINRISEEFPEEKGR